MIRKNKYYKVDASEFSDDEDLDVFQSENDTQRRLNAYKIKRIKHNHPDTKHVSFGREYFSEKGWARLGDYLASNNHVECMSLRQCNLNDSNMSVFFKGAQKSSLVVLTLYSVGFGSEGIRCLVPFLQNACNLTSLNVSGNLIKTEGLWWLMKGLTGGSIEKLNLRHCGLTNLAVIEKCSLTNLQVLYLSDNSNIDGCESIAELLRRGGSKLKKLYLNRCNIRDEGAEMIANSLTNNTSLTHLELESNNITLKGQLALLRLVNDISSVNKTYNSNHTLRLIGMNGNAVMLYNKYIQDGIQINRHHGGKLIQAGRAKVIKYQINSNMRSIVCGLQGVSDKEPFFDIDSIMLPELVSLVGRESGFSDMYRLLLARSSDLGFSVYGTDNKALKEKVVSLTAIVAEQSRQIAALTAQNLDLRTKIASINGRKSYGKKRPISDVL